MKRILPLIALTLALAFPPGLWAEAQKSAPQKGKTIPKSRMRTLANGATPGSENRKSQVEGKLFTFLEGAYARRDQADFERIYKVYLESFPASTRMPELREFRSSFYYSESMQTEALVGSMVRISHPDAKNIEDLQRYFERLSQLKVSTVIMEVAQNNGTPIYLFSNTKSKFGYYFETKQGPVIENLLPQIVALAHEFKISVHAAFSIRNLPALSNQRVYMMDDSWNFLSNQTKIVTKLDLFHPKGKDYLYQIMEDLIAAKVDGILIKRDFAYKMHEGFSQNARSLFKEDTGIDIQFGKIFIPTRPPKGEFGLLSREEYWDIANWKTKELKQSLWELVTHLRTTQPKLKLGLEVIPEMLNDLEVSMKKYSTGLRYLKDLDLDYVYLSRRDDHHSNLDETQAYNDAALQLREAVPTRVEVVLTVPLNERNRNIIHFNEDLESHWSWKKETKGLKIAVGSVTRFRGYDFLQLPYKSIAAKVVQAK